GMGDPGRFDWLQAGLGGRVTCECRDDSWFDVETYEVIRAHAGALVVTDEEKWPRAPQVALGPVAYFRLSRGYTNRSLEPWLEAIRAAIAAHDEVHVYFKHDPQAPRLALPVRSETGGAGSGSPRPS